MTFHFPHISISLRMVALILLLLPSNSWGPGLYETAQPPAAHQSLANLPPDAQFAISRILGRDDKNYHVIPTETGFRATHPTQALEANFTREGAKVHVDAAGAAYPLVIDPWIQQAKLTASGGAVNDVFGSAVAISGDTVVVGAAGVNAGQGSAYVFVKPGGSWHDLTQVAKLTASDGATLDWFGYFVAISGDTVGVGAPGGPTGGSTVPGAAYVFVKPGGDWADMTQTAKLTASDGAVNDRFGISVAISGDIIVAGALFDDIGTNTNQGSAYVFVKSGGGWADMTQTVKLTASDGVAETRFGSAVAISGDTLVVGALGVNTGLGSAYVFVKPGGGWANMTQTAKLTPSDGATNDYFGFSVAISGDALVVGANGDAFGVNNQQGSAYVFAKPGGGWADMTQTAKLTASDGAAVDAFGWSVAISGDTVLVGALFDDIGINTDQGSAYVFVKPGGGWVDMTQTAKLTASDGAVGDAFGWSVAISGTTIVVGAYTDDIGANADQGSAYVFGFDTLVRLYVPLVVK